MIIINIEKSLPRPKGFDKEIINIELSADDGTDIVFEYEVDSGGFLYLKKLDEEGEQVGIEKDNYTGEIHAYGMVDGDEQDLLLYYKFIFLEGKLQKEELQDYKYVDSSIRKQSIQKLNNNIKKLTKVYSSKLYRYIYKPYSLIANVIFFFIISIIYYPSFYLIKLLNKIKYKLVPYG